MATEKQIYVSFDSAPYKNNKKILLVSQAEIIGLQKLLVHLNAIRQNKKRLLALLMKKMSSLNYSVDRLYSHLPELQLSRSLEDKLRRKSSNRPSKQKEKIFRHSKDKEIGEDNRVFDLDMELAEIQKKLASINNF